MKNIFISTQPTEKRVIAVLFALVGILLIVYTYAVSSAILHVTARKDIEYRIHHAHVAVGKLEAEYLEKSHQIAREVRASLSLTTISNTRYVQLAEERTLTLYDES